MTQEDKDLLLQDLCARLPYGVKCYIKFDDGEIFNERILAPVMIQDFKKHSFISFIPYLRPISSMTEEEKEELLNLLFDKEAKYFYIDEKGVIDGKTSNLMKEGLNYPTFCPVNIELYTDWLNSRHFDYRGLLERGLAIEAPVGMYNIKEK